MERKRICTLIAGIINLLYAVILTGGVLLGLILGISLGFGLNFAGNDFAASMAAIVGTLVLVIVIIALIIMIPPCICTLISSILLIKRAVKSNRPKGPAILSIVIHSLMLIGFLIGLAACIISGGPNWVIFLIVACLLISVADIVLCGIAMSSWDKE